MQIAPTHENNPWTGVSFHEDTLRYMHGSKRIPALLSTLADSIWPSYDYKRAQRAGGRKKTKDSGVDLYLDCIRMLDQEHKRAPPPCVKRRAKRARLAAEEGQAMDGLALGIQVDTEMTEVTRLLQKHPGLHLSHFVQQDAMPLCLQTEEDRDRFRKLVKHRRVYTDRLIKYLVGQKWRPVHAQLVVHNPRESIATKVDLVCQRDNGSLVVVELKCGFDGKALRSCTAHKMLAPFHMLNDCPFHQHQVQLAFTYHMFCHSFMKGSREPVPNIHAVLIYVRETHVLRLPLHDVAKNAALTALDGLPCAE